MSRGSGYGSAHLSSEFEQAMPVSGYSRHAAGHICE